MLQTRQPKGTSAGGQFAPHGRLETSSTLDDDPLDLDLDPGWTGPLDDCPVPQANSPVVVCGVVDALDGGCATATDIAEALGIDHRQGLYYARAAEHLGLAERYAPGGGESMWDLTDAGRQVAGIDGEGRAVAMAEIMADSEYVDLYLEQGEQALAAEVARHGLSPTTVSRRVATICAWADFATSATGADRSAVAAQVSGIRTRAAGVVAMRQARHQTKREVKRCPSCHITLPSAAADECDACGEPLSA